MREPRSLRAGFSLVELLVVIAIALAFMGLFALGTTTQQRGADVRAAAEELAAVLRETHHRALKEHTTFGVAFNIQNAPGSSGKVLNNRSGGHYYRVIGPSHRTRAPYLGSAENIPLAHGQLLVNGDHVTCHGMYANFPDFVDDVARSWISEPHVLMPGRVRFLALSDTEEGPRREPWNTYYWANSNTTYPRPWFGYFDPATKRLWPWGGYDTAVPKSGFYYEGSDGPITGCLNPSSRTVNHDWDAMDFPKATPWTGANIIADKDINGDGDMTDEYEKEVNWPIWEQGQPRPVVNADWLDACISFRPNGEVEYLEWNRARRAYLATVPPTSNTAYYYNEFSGIPDRAKSTGAVDVVGGNRGCFTDPYPGAGTSEVAHFDKHTGGYRITLGPDSPFDQDTFISEEEAADSISPAWRVEISTFGVVTVYAVQKRKGYLKSLPPSPNPGGYWPENPAVWLDTSPDWQNPVNNHCHFGYLNLCPSSGWGWANTPTPGTPTGQPIVDILDPKMMSQRVWWKEP